MKDRTLEVNIYGKDKRLIDDMVIITNGRRVNFEKLKKYTCSNYQWDNLKHSIDLLNDYGFNNIDLKSGVYTQGLENFISYKYGKIEFYIKIFER